MTIEMLLVNDSKPSDSNLDRNPKESPEEIKRDVVIRRGFHGLLARWFGTKSGRFHLTAEDTLRAIATSGLLMSALQYMAADLHFLKQYPASSAVLSVLAAILIDLCHRYVGDVSKNGNHGSTPVPPPQNENL